MTPVFISNHQGMVRGWAARAPTRKDGYLCLLVQCPLDLDDGERVTLAFSNPVDGTEMEACAEAAPAGVLSGYWLRIVAWRRDYPTPPGLVREQVVH